MPSGVPTTFGAQVTKDGVAFSLWAPSAASVELLLDGRTHRLAPDPDGWCRTLVEGARAGSRYRYRIDGLDVPDPASRHQPDDVFGESRVEDPAAFAWTDTAWRG